MGRVTKRVNRLGARLMQNSVDAAQTVTARMPVLMTPTPSMSDLDERNRMVAEKVDAFSQGAIAAGMALSQFWIKAAFGGVRGPADVFAGMLDITNAAIQPASVKVRANAKRLTRR